MPSSQQKHCRACAAPAYCTHHGALLPAPTASNSVKVLLSCYHLSWLASLQSEHCSWNMYHHTSMLSPYHLIIILWPCYHHVIIVCSSSVSKFIRPTRTLSSFVCNSRWRVSMASGKSTGAKPLKPCPSPLKPLPASSVPGASRSPVAPLRKGFSLR